MQSIRTSLRSVLFLFSTAVALASAEHILPRATMALDRGWRFTLDDGGHDRAAPQFDDSDWQPVTLPHTWNAFDGQDGGHDYHRGTGWYRTWFRLSPDTAGHRVLLEFDGASREAEVFVNGRIAGRHTGAFARFRFDVTGLVSGTGDNVLAVRVNNAAGDIIPRSGDFTLFGGLYRRVRLLLTGPAHIATLDHASPGVYLQQEAVTSKRANVAARVKLINETREALSAEVCIRVVAADGTVAAESSTPAPLGGGATSTVVVPLQINRPHLWNGRTDPYLYHVIVELAEGTRVLDAVEQPLGLRSFAVKPDAGFFLNGRRYELHGVNRHQDRMDRGWAITEADQREDFGILLELGATVVRLAHYQHDQLFHALCDESGVGVWAELCFVGKPPRTPEGVANAKEQLRELIRQNYNHPAIFFWSIGNETSGPEDEADKLLRELAAVVRGENPTRPSVYASHHPSQDPRNFCGDLLAVNKYFGWYRGAYADFGEWLDAYHRDHPDRPLAVSEYGAGASVYQHEENPPIRIHMARGPWHPEEWQTRFHEEHWLQIKQRPYLWGTFIWNLFDFASDGRDEGDHAGRNDKGLVTYDRRVRKDAFYWYQANWSARPMVHIVSKRHTARNEARTEIRVYSNAGEVEVVFNGVALGRKSSTDRRFVWSGIELKRGPNRVNATAYRGGRPVATDSACWIYRTCSIEERMSATAALEKFGIL